MTSRQLDEEAVFHVAREIAKREARSGYLDQVCAGDQALRERVESLLDVHEREQDFLRSSPEPAATVDVVRISEGPGHQIGRYKLLQKIGEGGFGVVYMAEQQRPVRRKVALKIIKPGMDTHAAVARFEAERQALALMDHPNISRVLDGGATDSGRPYFVMELVKGVPISEYCDANHLPTDERLRLFISMCQAVQHAHQKGVIHRDLKPSNVLVTLHDGQPVAKVIDFGIAKAINQQLTERTLFTVYGQMVGTPQYMSPEQAEMSGLDVDTRSDVYSLGVLLYELLTGTTPIDGDRLRTAGYAEMQRIIREEEPPKPSIRLSTAGDKLTIIARHRGLSPERLHKTIRGDLDWIVMKALEKDRSRRYETPNSLAADINRYLNEGVVEARPPSTVYRLRKAVARHRVALFVIGVFSLSLIAATVISTWFAIEAGRQRDAVKVVLRDLWEELADRGLDAAFSGDLAGAQDAIGKLDTAGAPIDMRETLTGLALLFDGKNEAAVAELKKATTTNSNSFLAHSALWWTYRYSSDFGNMFRVESLLRERQLSPTTDYDRLFLYLSKFQIVAAEEIKTMINRLDLLVEDHTRWGAAYAVRAVAWNQHGQECHSPEDLRRAIDDVGIARSLLQDSPLILTIALSVVNDGIEMAKDRGNSADVQTFREMGEGIVAKLRRRTDTHMGERQVAVFYYLTDQTTRARVLEEELVNRRMGGWITQTSLRIQEPLELEVKLRTEVENGADEHTCLAFVLAEKSEDGRREAMRIFREVQANDRQISSKVLALNIPLLLGRPGDVRQASQELLASNLISHEWRSWNCMIAYHAGEMSEDEFRRRAGPFGVLQAAFYHQIAMESLAIGDRPKAREYFARTVATGQVCTWNYHSAQYFLRRLEEDQSWPSWIRASGSE